MNKPKLSDLRKRDFTKALGNVRHLPIGHIVEAIDSGMHPLDYESVYRKCSTELAETEYKECLSLFERRLPKEYKMPTGEAIAALSVTLQFSTRLMSRIEDANREALENAAVDIVKEIFDVPDHIIIKPTIESSVSVDIDSQEFDSKEFLSLSEKEKSDLRNEIKKRIVLNGLVHGSAMHIWKTAHYIIKSKIDEIDPMLMGLYNEFIAATGFLIWQVPPDLCVSGTALGVNQLQFNDDSCTVLCNAINFPVLIHEVTKGVIDYLISRGIPSNLTEGQLKYYYDKADDYNLEGWHYLLSPGLWGKLVDILNVDTQSLPSIIARLSELNYDDLSDLMIRIVKNNDPMMKLKSLGIV